MKRPRNGRRNGRIVSEERLLRSGDPNTVIERLSAKAILERHGFPSYLLGSSAKMEKCDGVGVLARVLYLTPGVFCAGADTGCLLACLGHNSGRMGLPHSYTARDKRTAFYVEHQEAFLERLKAEIHLLKADAYLQGLRPAVRLNGSSDLAWERRHPELFRQFSDVQFYDYTKLAPRILQSLGERKASFEWPANYRLTLSASPSDALNGHVLSLGGTVATVFWPRMPKSWLGATVVDGDKHDARFLDPAGTVVGLRAKGIARVDVTGFTRRPCPDCGPPAELAFESGVRQDGAIRTRHACAECRCSLEARVADPYQATVVLQPEP